MGSTPSNKRRVNSWGLLRVPSQSKEIKSNLRALGVGIGVNDGLRGSEFTGQDVRKKVLQLVWQLGMKLHTLCGNGVREL
jgi:hypothetical protein